MDTYFIDKREELDLAKRDLRRFSPQMQLERLHQRLDDTTALLQTRIEHHLSLRGERLSGASLGLHSLSPLLTIARGYAVVRRTADQHIVTSIQHVQPGDELTIQVTDGQIQATVEQDY